MTDRIKLAEAMFPDWNFERNIGGDLIMRHALDHDGESTRPAPNPFTDANDDYAVLEWMRSDESSITMHDVALKLWEVARNRGDCNALHNYQIGDYARAVLKTLDSAKNRQSES